MATAELTGNAARGDDLAWVALARRAAGSPRPAARATARPSSAGRPRPDALEAAAVPGPPLALDALHDALGPAVRARPDGAASPSR